jgi:hypothetical protein
MCLSRGSYIRLSGTVFSVIALVHLYRAVVGLPAVIGGFAVPTWASWLVVVVASYLTYNAWVVGAQK